MNLQFAKRPDEVMRGRYITTFSGIRFYPLDPFDVSRICIEDIAHALSNCCRFVGHCREFYSVAQHSMIMAGFTNDVKLQRWALMHDACEAYVGDMARPMKSFYVPWRRIERRILQSIAEKFGLPWPIPDIIKTWDAQLLMTETRDLLPAGAVSIPGVDVGPMDITIRPIPPLDAEHAFLTTFDLLFGRGHTALQAVSSAKANAAVAAADGPTAPPQTRKSKKKWKAKS